MDHTLRKATEDDREFLRRLHHTVVRRYVEAIWGWDEVRQDEFVRQELEQTSPLIIEINGQSAGQITVNEREDEWTLVQLFILPEFQGQGIGTALLQWITREADCCEVPIVLRVFKANPARHLYERFGFCVEREDDICFHMRRPPVPLA